MPTFRSQSAVDERIGDYAFIEAYRVCLRAKTQEVGFQLCGGRVHEGKLAAVARVRLGPENDGRRTCHSHEDDAEEVCCQIGRFQMGKIVRSKGTSPASTAKSDPAEGADRGPIANHHLPFVKTLR
jgi:hypothetical protein